MTRSDVSLSTSLAIACIAMAALSPTASARGGAPSASDGLTTCQRAVSRIGAQMGHTLQKDADGSDIYVFVVRSDGGNYSVRCNGGTGTLGTIDRVAHSPGDAASRQ